MEILLFIIIGLVFITSLLYYRFDVATPSVLFSFSFLFQMFWVVLYASNWQLNLHLNTFLVLSLGVFGFFISTVFISYMFRNRLITGDRNAISVSLGEIRINPLLEIVTLAFLSLGLILYLFFIVRAVHGSFDSLSSLSAAIGEFDRLSKFTTNYDMVRVPSLINNLKVVAVASGYWFAYVVINNYLCSGVIKLREICIVLLGAMFSIASGSRTPLFMMGVAGISYLLILLTKKQGTTKIMTGKRVFLFAAIGFLFMASFLSFGTVLGRTITRGTFDYLSIYCGAEVKNLDLFLQETKYPFENDIWGSQTFVSLIKSFGEKLGFEGYQTYNLDLPFRYVHGYGLGNVYTTFYPYIYDFGYLGCAVLVFIMASISQFVYEKTRVAKLDDTPNLFILVYGVLVGCLILSFFSNKFYEIVFSMDFLKNVVIWWGLNLLFAGKIRFMGKKYCIHGLLSWYHSGS